MPEPRICPTPNCVSYEFANDEEKFCPMCGREPILGPRPCTQCGRGIEPIWRFCQYCGLEVPQQEGVDILLEDQVQGNVGLATLRRAGFTVIHTKEADCPVCRNPS